MKNLHLQSRLFFTLFLVGVIYIFAFFFPKLLIVAHGMMLLVFVICILDYLLLFMQKKALIAERILPEKLSNGDVNKIKVNLTNNYFFRINVNIIDEIPFQFQVRDFSIKKKVSAKENIALEYTLEPKERGEYSFGVLNVYASSPIGFVTKRYRFQGDAKLPCYPSFIHLGKYELIALQNEFLLNGSKRLRRLGHTMEFEQIKEYVAGDDIRSINWKATSKQNQLMVNQYQDEKAQRVYMLIDKGRTMQMPFNGLSLLDYAINASMALSHVILKKNDRAGMLTFSKKAENKLIAENRPGQLRLFANNLYAIQTNFYESDFNKLYQEVRFHLGQRSLLILFTNFETLDALNRQLKYIRALAKNHLVVLVFFKNSELQKLVQKDTNNLQEVYDKIVAEKFEFEKQLIIQELRKHGIHSLYTLPENLNINLINKYLEIKARGIL